ncbi:MAG: protein-L-isoaspartate O-methyltransferase [Halolamina sp.]
MDPAALRDDMVDGLEHALDRQLPPAVTTAMRAVPREEFVPEAPYDNRETEAVGTRVLSPTAVARLLTALDPQEGEETLLVGAGVGYTAAVVAEIVGAKHVHALDISRDVVREARSNLDAAGYGAVLVDWRDGAEGLPEYAPFDRVVVEAAAVAPPAALVDQLAADGRLVMPYGTRDQQLVAVAPDPEAPDGYAVAERFGSVRFSPLLVEGEQAGRQARNRTEREDREFAQQGYFAPSGWEYEWVDWDDRLSGRERRGRR